MRDQLEEAHKHRDDGYGRAQHLNQVELPKRFYGTVDVARGEGGYTVTLDGRGLRTPGKKIPVMLPVHSLAKAMAEEWAEQERVWDGVLVKLARKLDVAFQPTIGIIHQPQPASTLEKLDQALEGLGLHSLTAMVSITGITGSGLLAIALLHQLLDADEVWTAAHVDEDHQIRLWGEDEEATERRAKRRVEFDVAVRVVEALR